MKNTDILRKRTLSNIEAWCYQRASHLSLNGNEQAAQAITEEHMETLQSIKPENLLWMNN